MKKKNSIDECIRTNLEQYLADLDGADPVNMYDMVIQCVEKPVLEMAMIRAEGNQSRASEMLGMTRTTLRKKLIAHGML